MDFASQSFIVFQTSNAMAVSKNILGMNARNFLYIRRYNKQDAKRIADDKLETKIVLVENQIATPKLLATFLDRDEIQSFDWNSLPTDGFVVKPARGYGGGGILPIKKWNNYEGTTISGETYTQENLKSHLLDILEGAYSLQYLPDKAFIEERLISDPIFKKLGAIGLPDIRIIVLNHVPVMAMLRLPTQESKGKANLHQGAIGIGIDMRTGITTHSVYKGKKIEFVPNTKIKIRGMKIPRWDDLLLLAAKTQSIIPGLGYAGVDIVIDQRFGPMVLEVNARPGLSIQVANNESLRTRLERVENLPIETPIRGVEVSKSLFAASFAEKVKTSPVVLGVIQEVTIKNNNQERKILAKLDTGAHRTSIDHDLAHELNLYVNTLQRVHVVSASGQNKRPTVSLTFELAGKKITTLASVIDRTHLNYPMIIGTRDLKGFHIDPSQTDPELDEVIEDKENQPTTLYSQDVQS